MKILLKEESLEVEIKKSRFIARCVPVTSAEDAMAALERLREPEATHNCWAYRIGEQYRFSDDGEPGGSAGRPILAAIDGQEINGVLAVVTRYFGGIKLGVGGLVRAYGNTVAQCLREAEVEEFHPMAELAFEVAFNDTYVVYGLIQQRGLERISEEYTHNGVRFMLKMREERIDEIKNALINGTRGSVRFMDDAI